jgi:hypothetical protein
MKMDFIQQEQENENDIKLSDSSHSISPEISMEQIYQWEIKSETLDALFKKIKPLDLIMFSGNNFISKTIRMVEKEKLGLGTISHVGIVLTKELLPHIKELQKGKFYIWESTNSKVKVSSFPKDILGKSKFGVQIRNLKEVVEYYLQFQGKVFWGKLDQNPFKIKNKDSLSTFHQRKVEIIEKFKEIEKNYGNSRFNLSFIDLGASVFPSLRPLRSLKNKLQKLFKRKKKKSKKSYTPFFCSEFVAMIYKNIYLLDENIDPANVVPVDFLGIKESRSPKLIKKIVEFKLNQEN